MRFESSTQYLQLATDPCIQVLVSASHLSLEQLQLSMYNPLSPMRKIFSTLIELRKTEKSFEEFHDIVDNKRQRLKAKEIKLNQEKVKYKTLADAKKFEYDAQFADIETANQSLDDLENKYAILETAHKKVKEKFETGVLEFAKQFEDMRSDMKNAFLNGGMSRFEEKNVDDTLSYVLNLTEYEYYAH